MIDAVVFYKSGVRSYERVANAIHETLRRYGERTTRFDIGNVLAGRKPPVARKAILYGTLRRDLLDTMKVLSKHDFNRKIVYVTTEGLPLVWGFNTLVEEMGWEVYTVSDFVANCLKMVYPQLETRTVYHGIDIERFGSEVELAPPVKGWINKTEKPRALYVGFNQGRKGLDRLLLVWRTVEKRSGSLILHTHRSHAGWGTDLNLFTKGLDDVLITDKCGDLHEKHLRALYQVIDFYIQPAYTEGFGLPLIEAMACGKPLLAIDHASMREVVGDAGLLVRKLVEIRVRVPKYDYVEFVYGIPDIEDYKRKMEIFLLDEEARNRFAERAKKRAYMFDLNATYTHFVG